MQIICSVSIFLETAQINSLSDSVISLQPAESHDLRSFKKKKNTKKKKKETEKNYNPIIL